jgi:hypothetical protein
MDRALPAVNLLMMKLSTRKQFNPHKIICLPHNPKGLIPKSTPINPLVDDGIN